MRILPQRKTGATVADAAGDGHRVNAIAHENADAGVSQIVKTDMRQAEGAPEARRIAA
jgi:hypothetical protein